MKKKSERKKKGFVVSAADGPGNRLDKVTQEGTDLFMGDLALLRNPEYKPLRIEHMATMAGGDLPRDSGLQEGSGGLLMVRFQCLLTRGSTPRTVDPGRKSQMVTRSSRGNREKSMVLK